MWRSVQRNQIIFCPLVGCDTCSGRSERGGFAALVNLVHTMKIDLVFAGEGAVRHICRPGGKPAHMADRYEI